MPHDEPMSFAEAIRRDVIENGAEGLNPGDRERILAEHAAEQQRERAESDARLRRMVDAAFDKANGK